MTLQLLPPGSISGPEASIAALDRLYDHVTKVMLSRQHPVTGLLPASTAITVHGNYTHAWVRDNVYSVIGAWALGLAYRRRGDRPARARLLEQSVLKTMRGLLQAMMRQAAKVERFKHTQNPLDSLHAIYSASTGETVAQDNGWGHLQIDATSLFLLMLAQMTRSGLPILYTMDEVAFVQNLAHYIGPAYRIADYGIWERGRKINDGRAELNASSIGMAKAALEAIQGMDMFGEDAFGAGEGRQAVIHVVPDEIARARATLEALLPRESGSKEVDAALLSVIGWPAFAVEDPDLVARTSANIAAKLEGRWGAKRFLRDGHQTALEDHNRLHYEAGELSRFDGIESEWPLFFTYRYVTALLTGDREAASVYRKKLDGLLVERHGEPLLPELFIVPAELAEAERAAPGSQPRVPNENVPLLWAQSLYVVGLLLEAGLLAPADIDPLNRRSRIGRKPPVPVRLVVLAEDEDIRCSLGRFGVEAQRLDPAGPVAVCAPDVLTEVLGHIGDCPALGLTGRPPRRLGSLITAQAFRLSGKPTVFVPTFIGEDGFYFSFDNRLVIQRLLTEVAYVNRSWTRSEAPLLVLPVTHGMTESAGFDELARTLAALSAGRVPELAIRGVTLGQALADAHTVSLHGVPPGRPLAPSNRFEVAAETEALDRPDLSEEEQLELLYRTAGRHGQWATVRTAAYRLGRHDERLQDAVKEMVVRRKRIMLGRTGQPGDLVDTPLDNAGVIARLARACAGDPCQDMLAEEMVLFCGTAVKANPDLFRHCLTLRPLDLVGLLVRSLQRDRSIDEAEACRHLAGESPHNVATRLRRLIAGCPGMTGEFCLPTLSGMESDRPVFGLEAETAGWVAGFIAGGCDWAAWRDATGALLPVPPDFFARVWEVLHHCDALVIADPAEPAHRLDSFVLRADATPDERDFALAVELLLDRIADPAYRQLTVETLWAMSELLRARSDLRIKGSVAVDELLAAAVCAQGIADPAEAWRRFRALSPTEVAEAVAATFPARAGSPGVSVAA
ncbi:glycoside hydrolase family 15 protein [Indioceanicola profundi]|uniref:glycoside hydrolase family 15 protein n=1 Tax=Indioceanicola profundi TaxID=2220096 RepID=UPI000E6ABF44|nr:glycoside hydrolase family 15 protein [Indioceanicola profundi]